MSVQVEKVEQSKTGKTLIVYLSGTKYLASLDSGLNAARGQWIEAEIKPNKDPQFPAWVGKWTFSQLAAPQVPPTVGHSPQPPAAAASYDERNPPPERYYAEPSDNTQPWWSPFMSNMCAHAIQAGYIKAPEQLNQWALKAAQVAVAVKEEVRK